MIGKPLSGKRVLVTRPRNRAAGLAELIRRAGGEPILWPALEIRDPEDFAELDRRIGRLEAFDLAIFVSPTAVERGFARMKERRVPWPPGLAVAAIGPGTQRELAARGYADAIVPSESADSEALLAVAELQQMRGKRVVIFRGSGGREVLAATLAARGATVEYAECYRRIATRVPAAPPDWAAERLHAVAVSSSEGLASVAAALGRWRPDWVRESALFVSHPKVAGEAAGLGVREVVIAGTSDQEVAARLVAYFRDAK